MFALLVDWDGRPIDPVVTERLGQALGNDNRTVMRHQPGPGVLVIVQELTRCVAMPNGRWLIFNGHLQNHADLRSQFRGDTGDDAALYARAREAWGDKADARVIGEYAAIVVDPARREVELIRAALQGPPIHWSRTGGRLVVGSTARILFAAGDLRPKIDEQKIADSLFLNYAEGERSWFRGITRVAVGTRSRHDADGVRTLRHYDLTALRPVRLKTDGDYVEAASALLLEGTRAALEGCRSPAIALSGGLDSHAVAVHALSLTPPGGTLLALTGIPEHGWDGVTPPGTIGDERDAVAALAKRYPALRTVAVDAAGKSFGYRLEEMFRELGAPPRNAMNLHWLHDLHASARAAGCDVLLTGSMGNFTISFDGSGAPASWLKTGRWRRLVRETAARHRGASFLRALVRDAVLPHLPLFVGRLRPDAGLPAWCPLDAGYARTMAVARRVGRDRSPRSTRAARRAMLRIAAAEAGDLNQAMEAIHQIPIRDPTAYRPLVEFCMAIPDEQFRCDGTRRRLARRMLRGRVPDATIDEPRAGLQCADWLGRLTRERDALAAEIATLRDDPDMRRRLDLAGLADAVAAWPNETPVGRAQEVLQLALPRALTTARFIKWVKQGGI